MLTYAILYIMIDGDIMSKQKSPYALPIPVQRTLRKFGQDLRNARKRRRLTMSLVAERASISRSTLSKVENGNSGVSLGIYASVLFALGLLKHLEELADADKDVQGRLLEEEHLPQRVRRSSSKIIEYQNND